MPLFHVQRSKHRIASVSGSTTATILTFMFIAAVYWFERCRGAGWGDSVGFLATALEGFSWSPTAFEHFLYANLTAAAVRLVPATDPIVVLTSISIIFALLTLLQVYRTGIALTGNRFASLLGTVALAFSFTFWRQAEQIEVYTLATFCTASAFRAMFADIAHGSRSHLVAAGAWMGLAFLVHIQTILLVPLFIAYLFDAGRTQVRLAGISLLAALAGIGLLVCIATLSPTYDVGAVFFSSGIQDEVMTIGIRDILKGVVLGIAYACYAFHIHLAAILAGFVVLGRTAPKVLVHCLIGIVPVWFFAMRYPVSDQYVFFLNAYLILAVVGAAGYASLFARVPGRTFRAVALAAALVLPYGIYETAPRTAMLVPRLEAFQARKAYKGGLTYFLRPGLRTSPDLFELVRRQDQTGEPLVTRDTELWDRLQKNTHLYWELRDNRNR